MAKSLTSIKSFFEPVPLHLQSPLNGDPANLQSTTASIENGLVEPKARRSKRELSPSHWQPHHDYEEVSIGNLAPGPRRVSFIARVVNLYYEHKVHIKMPDAAKGCLKILVKDDSALILINLLYVEMSYHIRLGDLVTVWTTYVSSASSISTSADGSQAATLVTDLFPEGEAGCALRNAIQPGFDRSVCNTPLGYTSGRPLFGLMSLKAFFEERGDEVLNAKILVCVKAVGSISTSPSKEGNSARTLSVVICDESSEATLCISEPLVSSSMTWKSHSTILLISSPAQRSGRDLAITARTLIEIDPNISEAEQVRKWNQRENCPINEPVPADLFDIDAVARAPIRLQFTLASLDSFIRASPSQPHSGYLSVILSKIDLLSLRKRGQLFSMPCPCGTPVYANTASAPCAACGTPTSIKLRINPSLVAELADETGAIGSPLLPSKTTIHHTASRRHSKILWTDEAWTQLLGRHPDQLATLPPRDPAQAQAQARRNLNMLRYLEQRLSFMRVILLVGWTGDEVMGGRLVVLRVVG